MFKKIIISYPVSLSTIGSTIQVYSRIFCFPVKGKLPLHHLLNTNSFSFRFLKFCFSFVLSSRSSTWGCVDLPGSVGNVRVHSSNPNWKTTSLVDAFYFYFFLLARVPFRGTFPKTFLVRVGMSEPNAGCSILRD